MDHHQHRSPNLDDEEEEEEAEKVDLKLSNFSIREYTLRMRGSSSSSSSSSSAAAADSIGWLLRLRDEPMECRMFRWWASELEIAGSRSGSKRKIVVRSHRTKKRSIVELFAVAPHVVDDVAAEDVEEEGGEEDVNSDEREELLERLTRKRSRGLFVVRNGSGGGEGKFKRESKRKHQIKSFVNKGNKGKLHNVSASSKTGLSQLLHGSVLSRRQEEKNVPGNKKAAKVRGSSTRRRVKVIQSALILREKMRSSTLPSQGILKGPIRAVSVSKSRKSGRPQNSNLAIPNKSKKAKIHARFSVKNDDIIGQKKKANSHMKVTDALVMSASEDQTIAETKKCTAASRDTNPSSLDAGKLSGEDQDSPRVAKLSDNTVNFHVDLNHSPYGCGDSPLSNNCSSVPLSSNPSASSSEIRGPVARNSSESFMEYLFGRRLPANPRMTRMMDSHSMMDSSCSTLHGGSETLEPWMQRIRGWNGPLCQSMHKVPNSSGIISQAEPSCHQLTTKACSSLPRTQLCPPTDLQNKHPIIGLDQTDTCQDRCVIHGNLIGLPLNSQGEFMKLHSGDNQLKQNQNRLLSSQGNDLQQSVNKWSNIDCPRNKGKFPDNSVHLKEKASQCPDRRFLQVNCIKQCQERANAFEHHVNNVNQGTCSATCRSHNLMGGHAGVQFVPMEGPLQNSFHPVNQQIMRLMGKDVFISADSGDFQGFLDGRKWVDKEIMFPTRCNDSTEVWFSQHNSTPNGSTQHKWFDSCSSDSSGSNALCSMETEKNPPNFYHKASMDPKPRHAHMEDGLQPTVKNGISFDKCQALNWGSYAQRPAGGISSDNTTVNSSKLKSPPIPYNSCIPIQPSTGECQRPRIPFHGGRPNFAHSSYQDHLIFGSRQIMPPLLANVTSQRQFQDPSPSYSDMFSNYQAQRMSVAGAYPFTALRSMEFPCSSNATARAFGPAITAMGSPISPSFIAMQSAVVNTGLQETRKAGCGTRPEFPRRQSQDQTVKTKRRLLPKPAYFTSRFRMPSFPMPYAPEFQRTARDSLYPYSLMQCPSHMDLDVSRNKAVGNKETIRKDAASGAPESNTPKLDGEPRPCGNIKLAAGTKHIIDQVDIREPTRNDALGAAGSNSPKLDGESSPGEPIKLTAIGEPGSNPPKLDGESSSGRPLKFTAGTEHTIDNAGIQETTKNDAIGAPVGSNSPKLGSDPRPDVCIQETLGDDSIDAPDSSSPKLDSEPWPGGPIKLTPGAKHTIRPCRNADPDGYIPVHSSVPFTVGSNTGKVLDPQCKSAKVYQF